MNSMSIDLVSVSNRIDSLTMYCNVNSSFDICFNEVGVYVNEERTRTFLAIGVYDSNNLLSLVEDCDTCLSDFHLDPYYKDPSFHASFAWVVGDHEQWLRTSLVPVLNSKWLHICTKDPSITTSLVENITFRTGNKNFVIPLRATSRNGN